MKKAIALAALLAAAPLAARAADPVTLKLAFPPPPVSFFNGQVLAPWGKEIEDATHGAVWIPQGTADARKSRHARDEDAR